MTADFYVNLFLAGIWVFAAVYTVCRDTIPPPERPEDTVDEHGWSKFILEKVKQAEKWKKRGRNWKSYDSARLPARR